MIALGKLNHVETLQEKKDIINRFKEYGTALPKNYK
jgi:hypothetical protein